MKLEISVSGEKSEKIIAYLEMVMGIVMGTLVNVFELNPENVGGIVYYEEEGESDNVK